MEPTAMNVEKGLVQQATTQAANPASLTIREDATGAKEAVKGPRGFGFPTTWSDAAVNSGTRNGTGLNIRSYSNPMAGAHTVNWEHPPRYPGEVIQFSDSVQQDFWTTLANKAYSQALPGADKSTAEI